MGVAQTVGEVGVGRCRAFDGSARAALGAAWGWALFALGKVRPTARFGRRSGAGFEKIGDLLDKGWVAENQVQLVLGPA